MSGAARFWSMDLHVHTPGSGDVKAENFGSADDIVDAAIAAGLDAIAVTDHNTATWCDEMTAAAASKPLVILPGVEISTTEGHLLAIWEEGTRGSFISEVLVGLGIGAADSGKLDIAANVGFAEAARKVAASGGVAIAAHIDRPKGLLSLPVKAHLRNTLLEPALSALEIVHLDSRAEVEAKIADAREMSFVRGSDTWDADRSCHSLAGIGSRRTWVKAGRPDLVGLKHALADPELRVSLLAPPVAVKYPRVESVEIRGGFLDGQHMDLCPDLNCLLGGTGAGKSLTLEAIRFALTQQVDGHSFAQLRSEVDSRLEAALGDSGLVRVQFLADGKRFRAERILSSPEPSATRIFQKTGDEWAEVDTRPDRLIQIAAFSQGEILEYSRKPVGRMALVDANLDLAHIESEIVRLRELLTGNAKDLISWRLRVQELQRDSLREAEFAEQVRKLAPLFANDLVKDQEAWAKEESSLQRVLRQVRAVELPEVHLPDGPVTHEVGPNRQVFEAVSEALEELKSDASKALVALKAALDAGEQKLCDLQAQWTSGFEDFKKQLDDELEKIDPDASLASLRAQLGAAQGKMMAAREAKAELENVAVPGLEKCRTEREGLLGALQEIRKSRRELRRRRVSELNAKASGFVKMDVPNESDYADFRAALESLKVGSRVREEVLDAIARQIHPIRFARSLWNGKVNDLVDEEAGIDAASVARLLANIDDKDLWDELLDIQQIDRPDVLTVKFKKPEDGNYTSIEELAHGQKCTAILVILLADGTTPVLVDQPEDALHAPWIETYLVDTLRSLRGTRQYIFATRSPGIVVSADAEQIITMKATAGRGELEASGSLERHSLNALAMHHLEGGPTAFSRRARKLMAARE